MKVNGMRTASMILNGAIFVTTLILLAKAFRADGRWVARRGLKAFRYFTVLSNAFCGIAGLGMVLAQLSGPASTAMTTIKYLATVSVTVTLLTVFLFLGPTQGGYRELLRGRDLYMHLLGPVMAIGSYCLLEKRALSFAASMLGVLPVILYGAVYLYKVVYDREERRWEDFYGFNKGGRWPVALAAMLVGNLAVCALFWLVPPVVF